MDRLFESILDHFRGTRVYPGPWHRLVFKSKNSYQDTSNNTSNPLLVSGVRSLYVYRLKAYDTIDGPDSRDISWTDNSHL
jgi:hypothetical protein